MPAETKVWEDVASFRYFIPTPSQQVFGLSP